LPFQKISIHSSKPFAALINNLPDRLYLPDYISLKDLKSLKKLTLRNVEIKKTNISDYTDLN
jgi:hypothetical protein